MKAEITEAHKDVFIEIGTTTFLSPRASRIELAVNRSRGKHTAV